MLRLLIALWCVGSSWTRDGTCALALQGRFITTVPPRKPQHCSILNVEYQLEETIFTDSADECIWRKNIRGNASQYTDLGHDQLSLEILGVELSQTVPFWCHRSEVLMPT